MGEDMLALAEHGFLVGVFRHQSNAIAGVVLLHSLARVDAHRFEVIRLCTQLAQHGKLGQPTRLQTNAA
jgi:hypothetical protein